MSGRLLKRYNLPRSIRWPRVLDPRSYVAILYSFRETDIPNYMPGIEVNPEEEIVREAERIQKMFERKK